MADFLPGQRWFSSAEPELGLGTVLRLAGRQVQIVFTGSGVLRWTASACPPAAGARRCARLVSAWAGCSADWSGVTGG